MDRPVIALLAVVVLLAAVPAIGMAETRTGGTVTVGPDETIEDDLTTFAGSVVLRGTVEGNLEAAGGDVRITESGTVDGDVETAGGSAILAGHVGGNVEAAGGSVRVMDTARIDGSLRASGGSILVDSTVGGDAKLAADTITLGPNADIQGDLSYDGNLVRKDGSAVGGTVTRESGNEMGFGFPGVTIPDFGPALGVYGALVTLLVGALLLFVFPVFSQEVADRVIDDPVWTGGIGLLATIAIPIVLVVLFVTIIAIPLSLAGFVLYALVLWAASIYGRYAIGEWLLSYTGQENRWLALVVGVVVVALVTLVPILGALIEAVLLVLGFGAIMVGLRERYRGRNGSEPATTPDAGAV